MIKSIVKRDGRVVLYDESKIANAVYKALLAAGVDDFSAAAAVANTVGTELEKQKGALPPTIEEIQDAVERALMHAGYEEAAKKYIL